MTSDEITRRLREWQEVMQSVEAVVSGLIDIFGSDPESPLASSVYALQGLATRQAAELIGTTSDWLENWWLEDRFGENHIKVQLKGEPWRDVKTIDELAKAIADDLVASERECRK